jgi:ribosome biogenesis GTPase / thiamine phosphate phosphatase
MFWTICRQPGKPSQVGCRLERPAESRAFNLYHGRMSEYPSDYGAMGWPPGQSIEGALAAWPDARLARVVAQHRSGYEVAQHPERGFRVQAPAHWLRPRTDPELRAVVGDWVALDPQAKHIIGILPRHALLKRAAAGEHYQQQLIAANIDHVLLVSGMDADFNGKRIERYLLLIAASGAKPVLVLTKLDKCGDPSLYSGQLQALAERGIPVHALNAKSAQDTEALHRYLGPGKSAVLVGSSGAGKSTLTNTLLGTEKMKTRDVRETDAKGRHTTTHRALIALPQGGCLIDTPGMRELKLSGDERFDEGLFAEIDALAGQCRFSDCSHGNEPDCAIRAAIADGSLTEARYQHYCKLKDERDAAATTLADRRAQDKAANSRFGKRVKDKYGRK